MPQPTINYRARASIESRAHAQRFLTEPDDLVVDPFGGSVRTGLAAERLGRRWLVTDWMLEYLRGAAELFRGANGFTMHPAYD